MRPADHSLPAKMACQVFASSILNAVHCEPECRRPEFLSKASNLLRRYGIYLELILQEPDEQGRFAALYHRLAQHILPDVHLSGQWALEAEAQSTGPNKDMELDASPEPDE